MITTNKLSDLSIREDSRVLVIMPHPDDETVFASGLLHTLARHHVAVRVITMTQGEKSTLRHGLPPEADLAEARKQELTWAFHILGVNNFVLLKFPDGGLEKKAKEIKAVIAREIKSFHATHVLTLEPDGIYGHPDHVALSAYTTRVTKKPVSLLYATVSPHHILPSAKHMAKKDKIEPIKPDIKLRLSLSDMAAKLRAFRAHASQFMSLKTTPRDLLFFFMNELLTHEFYAFGN